MTPERKELIHEGERHERVLSNGHRGDPGAMSDALGYLIRVTRTQLHAETITLEECERRMAGCPNAKSKFSWAQAFAWIASVSAVVLGILQLSGKLQ